MKKNYLFILLALIAFIGLTFPAKTFAQVGINCRNDQPTCTSPDSNFRVVPANPKVGDWVNFVSGCQNYVADEATCNGSTCPFDISTQSWDVLRNSTPIQGQVANQSGRGMGIDRANRCISGVNSDNYRAVRPGTYTWYHGWGDSAAGHQEFPNYQLSDHVNSITFTITANGPTVTPGGPTITSAAPSATPRPPTVTQGGATLTPTIRPTRTPTPSPSFAPLPNCYDKLGSISFKKEDSSIETFEVFSQTSAPQTFVLKSGSEAKAHVYSITDTEFPVYNPRNSSLQLGNLPFITKNAWTWATPWCKPAIYLYPENPAQLAVKLTLDGKMTVSTPQYDPVNGWNVKADPEGTLHVIPSTVEESIIEISPRASRSRDDNVIPYLYYEADLNNVEIPKNGFVIPQIGLESQLTSMLTTLGFNSKEQNDFLSYWLPRLTDRPYYFVTLLPENVINEKETLFISNLQPTTYNQQPITPDSMIRSRFVFEGLDTPLSVEPLIIPSHVRNGFTLTDWGGTVVGKSCTDITVK